MLIPNHTNQHPQPQHQNPASATAAPASALATPGANTGEEVSNITITELLEQTQQLLDKATSFKIGGGFAQSAAKRLQSINTQLKVELLEERQAQLHESKKTCQHELEVAQLRLATADTRIAEFLRSTRECEAELSILFTKLFHHQELLLENMRRTLSSASSPPAPAPAVVAVNKQARK
jgi:hypothetical protein